MSEILTVDMTGAKAKLSVLREIASGKVKQYVLESFGARCVKDMKLFVMRKMTKTKGTGRRTSLLENNIGFKVQGDQVTVGTGLFVGGQEVKYARIQDQGGDIIPKNRQYLTIPFWGVKGVAANYPNAFVIRLKGQPYLVQRTGTGKSAKLQMLFSLRKKVHIPGTGWFTDTLEDELVALDEQMTPAELLRLAQKFASGGRA